MHRIDTSTAQVDKFGAGKNGFTGGNPQTGELPTALDADFFDSLQEEIAGVIEAAGITLKKDSNAQLLAAMRAIFTGRQVGAPIVMTATGTYIPSSPLVKFVEVELYAAGGGGAGVPAYSGSTAAIGGGGSAGSWVKFRVPASLVADGILVTIGTPGGAGASGGGVGGAGGNASFGSLVVCPGGLGSGYSTSSSATNAGGANSPADATIAASVSVIAKSRGQGGAPGYLSNNTSGSHGLGGASPVGASGPDYAGYGAGGSSARSISSDTSAKAGNSGGPGLCIIREMA